MVYALHKLKKKLEEDPTLTQFLEATARVEIKGTEVHQPHSADKDAVIRELPIEDIFQYDYDRECMDSVQLYLSGCRPSEPLNFLRLLEDLTNVEDHKDLLIAKPERDFAPLFRVINSFGRAPENRRDDHPVVTWLNANRGYPLNNEETLNIIFDAFEKVAKDYLISETENPLAPSVSPLTGRICKVSKEQHEKELADPTRAICELEEYTRPQVVSVSVPEDAAIYVALKSYIHKGTRLVALPPYLADLGVSNGWLSINPKNIVLMERTPSREDLMTIDSLLDSGMSLAQAVQSATKLK